MLSHFVHFTLRPKKYCVVPITLNFRIGGVGRFFILFYYIFFMCDCLVQVIMFFVVFHMVYVLLVSSHQMYSHYRLEEQFYIVFLS